MKKLFFYFIMASFISMLIGSGFHAVFKDVEIGKDHFEAGTLEIELNDKGGFESRQGFSLGSSASFSIEVKNISTLPLKYQVSVDPQGDLGEFIDIDLPQPGYLQSGELDVFQIRVNLPEDAGPESEGKNGSLEIHVRAYQEGFPDGFSDEKTFTKDIFSTSEMPEVEILSPHEGDQPTGQVLVEARAKDDFGLTRVTFYLDSILSAGTAMERVSADHYELLWNAENIPGGTHYLIVEASDGSGKTASDTVEVHIPEAE